MLRHSAVALGANLSRTHRNHKPKQKAVMRGNAVEYTQEQKDTIAEWCVRYPKRKGIDMKRVRAEDGQRLQAIKDATGRTDSQIYARAVYHREVISGDVPKKASLLVPRRKGGPGKYKCNVCGETFATRQGLGGHTAGHNRQSTRTGTTSSNDIIKTMPIRMPVMPDGIITLSVPSHLLNQSLSQYVIVNTDGNYRLAKLV